MRPCSSCPVGPCGSSVGKLGGLITQPGTQAAYLHACFSVPECGASAGVWGQCRQGVPTVCVCGGGAQLVRDQDNAPLFCLCCGVWVSMSSSGEGGWKGFKTMQSNQESPVALLARHGGSDAGAHAGTMHMRHTHLIFLGLAFSLLCALAHCRTSLPFLCSLPFVTTATHDVSCRCCGPALVLWLLLLARCAAGGWRLCCWCWAQKCGVLCTCCCCLMWQPTACVTSGAC